MNILDLIDSPRPDIPRDRWSRPLIHPPSGGKRVPYTRCTTFVDCLDDKYNLQQWEKRMVALGLADRPDLLLAVAAHRQDKKAINRITDQAKEAAAAGAASTTGTAEHVLTERIDRGLPLGVIPAAYQPDLEAYRQATACLQMVEIEQFSVLDELEIGGTPDRVVYFLDRHRIADVKTGSIVYSGLKICMQLAVYAHSIPYDPASETRLPRGYEMDLERALVIHLPAGQGECTLYWADIATGWEAVQVAAEVRRLRARKGWFTPVGQPPPTDLRQSLAAASTVEELRRIWSAADAIGQWNDDYLQVALARKAELEGRAA